jgi:SAM-dependent methyltransferase
MNTAEIVAKQYNKWTYPKPIDDMESAVAAGYYEYGAPHLFGPLLWPERKDIQNLKILVAGCGTNSAAYNAFVLPSAKITGIDISMSSLQHCQYLKEKHKLHNLTLQHLSLIDIDRLGEKFDLIICTGVLHHLENPDEGLRALKKVLNEDGVINIMLYGQYLRSGVYMMQDLFRLLGCDQSQEDVSFVKETINNLPKTHPLHAYVKVSDDLQYDSGIVDTFLHPQDRAYTVPQIFSFALNNGLEFFNWEDRCNYSATSAFPMKGAFLDRLEKLSEKDRWSIIELCNFNMAKHHFYLRHPNKAGLTKINFENDGWLNFVPIIRPLLKVVEMGDIKKNKYAKLKRNWHEFSINNTGMALLQHVNGNNNISEIINLAKLNMPELKELDGFIFFKTMYDWGHLMYWLR